MSTRSKKNNLITGLVVFILVFALVFFGVQWFTKSGIFKIPGVVYYDESLDEKELSLLNSLFTEDVVLDKDVTISAENYLQLPELNTNEYLYSISVPVTDYYSSDTNIEVDSPESLSTYNLIDINELSFNQKLLSVNNEYYLSSFKTGALFRVISFESEKFEEEIKPLVDQSFTRYFPNKDNVFSFAQTGVTALSRGMNGKLDEVGDATYFAENIKDYLSSFDLTHTSNESSFSDYAYSGNICSDHRFIDTLTSIGLDIVELTGNHNQDCGDEAAIETIDIYNNNNIQTVGGGKTVDEAAIPLLINEKGNSITFLAYNQSTGGATYDDTPGANPYNEDNAIENITKAKERGDYVIIDVQYYECSAYVADYEDATCDFADSAAGDQVGFFRHLIDLGADLVVGTSAHQPQTFELYENGAIYYGLGNLFFDQAWWPGTTRSLVLEHYFYNGKLLQTVITPTAYDTNYQTSLLDDETKQWFLERLISERP
ncbi:CapA family protein [Candidatus Saccharibacteria bacterium]|nr:CapA family protein [Candidatus Saccharibacteria bacterium]